MCLSEPDRMYFYCYLSFENFDPYDHARLVLVRFTNCFLALFTSLYNTEIFLREHQRYFTISVPYTGLVILISQKC